MNMHNGHRSPEAIEAAIQRTRTDLDETLTQLEHSLTPGQLIDQGMDYIRNSSAREYLSNLSASAKRDPIPLALVGVGLAWLMMSGRRHDDSDHPAGSRHPVGDAARSAGQRASEMGDSARNKVHDLTDTAVQKAHDLSDSARQTARQLRDSARDQGERLRSGYEHVLAEQPLVLGAVGLAIGAVFAAMAPKTEQEERMLGSRSSGSGSSRGDGDGHDTSQRDGSTGTPASTSDGSTGSMHGTAASSAGPAVPGGTGGSSSAPAPGSAASASAAAGSGNDQGRTPGSSASLLQSPRPPASDTAASKPPDAG